MAFSKLSYVNVHDMIKKFDKFSGSSHFSMTSSGEPAATKAKKVYIVHFVQFVCTVSLPIRGQPFFLLGELMTIHMRFTVYHARS